MSSGEILRSIRLQWLEHVLHWIARVDGVRASFRIQLTQFYDDLVRAVEVGDPALIYAVLEAWGETRAQSELQDARGSLPSLINQIWVATFQFFREQLTEQDALNLIGAVQPVFSYALDRAATIETQLHVRHVSLQLERVRMQLERLEKSKSDFIAVAAHELKTPLTLIEGYSSMMQETIPTALDQPFDIYIQGIHGGTRPAREIVDDMIDVSMIDNDLLSLSFQPLWINRLLDSIQREVKPSLQQRNQTLRYRKFSGMNEMTYGDGERLLQAFRNLITNAIKYTPDGGTITVDGRKLPGFIEVIVSDTGIGIDAVDHTRIFEKFGRLGDVMTHSSGKTKFKGGGPGLGLPITKGIIEAHGGTIWVESPGYDEQGCPGSVFHVLLPLRKAPPDDKSAKLFARQPDAKKAPKDIL